MATKTVGTAPIEPTAAPQTRPKDAWWVSPLSFFVLFSAFGIWATFRAFENGFYWTLSDLHGVGPHYLSPFYSPTFKLDTLGIKLGAYSISPALLILPFPLSFRLSCYYYRKSIYRAYLADPLGCAVPEPKFLAKARFHKYTGERVFPFVVQNFHRFAFYAAVVFIVILWKDTYDAFFFTDFFTDRGVTHFGVGIGSLVFLVNICLLTLYTFSCHSWRHLIGGGVDCYSCTALSRTRYGLWQKVSFLNERHGLWAMTSLVSVALVDVYVWLVATGHISQTLDRLF